VTSTINFYLISSKMQFIYNNWVSLILAAILIGIFAYLLYEYVNNWDRNHNNTIWKTSATVLYVLFLGVFMYYGYKLLTQVDFDEDVISTKVIRRKSKI
jgi:heme/copper-type cytochrome/quinol oxidase subunit 2